MPNQDCSFEEQSPASESEEKIFSKLGCEDSLDYPDPLVSNPEDTSYSTRNLSMRIINLSIPHPDSTNTLCFLSNDIDNSVQLSSKHSPLHVHSGINTNLSSPSPTSFTSDTNFVYANDSDVTSINSDQDKIGIPDWNSSVVDGFDDNAQPGYSLPGRFVRCTKKQKKGRKRSRCFIPRSMKPVILALFEEYLKADSSRTVSDIANQIFHDDLKHMFK